MIRHRQKLTFGMAKHLCLMLLAFFAIASVQASGLSGKYTIDPSKKASATNYLTFNDADSDLTLGVRSALCPSGTTANGPGVTGAVTFQVADGTYNEQLLIPAITGASATNTITFNGHLNDSTKVIITDNTSGSYTAPGYVIHLDNASFINFNEITVQRGVSTSTYAYYDHVIIVDNVSDSNSFTKCQMIGVYTPGSNFYGALVYSGYNYTTYTYSTDQYNKFQNNYMKNGYYGFYWMGNYTTSGAEIGNLMDHNYMDSLGYYGMLLQYQDSITITNNKINMPNGNYALYCYGLSLSGYGGNVSLIANNFIAVAKSTTGGNSVGMNFYNLDNTNIVYNNINIYGSGSYAAYIYPYSSTSALNIYNNNFINSSTSGIALWGQNFTNEDYNNFRATSGNLITYSGTTYKTLSAWRTGSSTFGTHDTTVDPIFVSNTDLHVNNPALNATGTPLAYVTSDIDGDVRNASTPDIGADEFTPPALNPKISAVTNPVAGFCVGSQNVIVTFSNFGLNTMTSATIEWSVNGTAQTAYSWTGSLASGANTSINVGSFNFSSSSLTYTVVSYPSKVNGVTFTSTGTSSSINVKAGLNSGTYTIDPSGSGSSNYTSFRAAANDLNSKGICGSVIFNVATGTYNESVQLNTIPGVTATKTVTFQSKAGSASSVTLDTTWGGTYSAPGYVVNLNGTMYVSFNNITMTNYIPTSYSYGDVVLINNGASNINIKGCNLLTNTGSSVTNYGSPIYDPYGSTENYINVSWSHMTGGEYVVYLAGSYGGSERGHVFYHNTIDSGLYYGLITQYCDSLTISHNTIFQNTGYAALYIYAYQANSDTFRIDNNFVTNESGNGYAMMSYYVNLMDLYFNSINNNCTSSSYPAAYLYNYVFGGASAVVNSIDNIFNNEAGGMGLYTSSAASITNSDYNDIYSNGGSAIGTWNGTSCATLSDWQTASSMDANSVSSDPGFSNSAAGDLHLTGASHAVAHKGVTITNYTTDIDTQSRNSKPCIGADETPLVKNDASVEAFTSPTPGFCAGTKDIYVTIGNEGTTPITSVDVHWSVGGTAQTTYSWTGTLAALGGTGTTATVKLGTVTFASGVSQLIVANTHNPNGSADGNPLNDTLKASMAASLNGTYTLGGLGANFASFNDAAYALNTYGVCGPVVINVTSGYYNESLKLRNIIGTSSTNTVTFQSKSLSATTVILDSGWGSFSARGYTVALNGSKYVNFRYMTMSNYGSGSYGYADVVELNGGASYNTFDNCQMLCSTSSTSNYGSVVYNPYGSVEQFNNITNNLIVGGYYGVYMVGNYSTPEFGNVVSGNTIDSARYYGVMSEYEDSMMITGNNIYLPTGYYGIYVYQNMSKGSGNDSSYIANNFMTTSGSYGYTLMVYYSTMLNVYYNSINASSSSGYAAYFYNYTSGAIINVVDNIFVNDGGGYALYESGSSGISFSDYNDWYTTGSTLAYWNGSSCAALSDLQTANSMDASSVSADPLYNSASTGDLHLTKASTAVQHKGIKLSAISKDIDNASRSSKPDMGADEFNSVIDSNDVGVSAIINPASSGCGSSNTIALVKVSNFGTKNMTAFKVHVDVTGTKSASATLNFPWTLNGSNSSWKTHDTLIYVTFSPALNTVAGGTFSIKAYTSPKDQDSTNDTAYATVTLTTPPTASFTVANICQGLPLNVTKPTIASTYLYRLFNSSGVKVDSSTSSSPIFKGLTSGTYRVWQGIWSSGGCYDSTSMMVTVYPKATAAFSYTRACIGDTAKFTDASTAGAGTISTYAWSLGNATTSSSPNPTAMYSKGLYTVTLKITTSNGCMDSTSQSVTVDSVHANFTHSISGTSVSFTAGNTSYSSYAWDFGDKSAAGSGSTTSHSYVNGHFTATMTATNASGCSASWSDTFTVMLTGLGNITMNEAGMTIYPNPFTSSTTVSYNVDKSSSVKVVVYDMTGRTVATLVDHNQAAGSYNVNFTPSENNVNTGGMYIVRMTIGDQVITKQITMVK